MPHILVWVLFFTHIPFAVNRTFNTTPTERLQQYSTLTIHLPSGLRSPVLPDIFHSLWPES